MSYWELESRCLRKGLVSQFNKHSFSSICMSVKTALQEFELCIQGSPKSSLTIICLKDMNIMGKLLLLSIRGKQIVALIILLSYRLILNLLIKKCCICLVIAGTIQINIGVSCLQEGFCHF